MPLIKQDQANSVKAASFIYLCSHQVPCSTRRRNHQPLYVSFLVTTVQSLHRSAYKCHVLRPKIVPHWDLTTDALVGWARDEIEDQ